MIPKKDIRKTTEKDLALFFDKIGEKPFRMKQVQEWLWVKSASSFDEMSNVSQRTRELLSEEFSINAVSIDEEQVSNDKTIKYSFKLHDNHLVEGVLIPTEDRMTACISSQVGCSLTCKFCATGYLKRERNLDPAEIYDQVVLIRKGASEQYDQNLSNIVYMGMGEPLLNYNNVLESVNLITSDKGLGMSPRRITVSTAGIAKQIKRLGDDQVKFNLALSLHAANDKKRNEIMPINESNTLKALEEALNYYFKKTRNKVTFEYIVFDQFNDTLEDAKELLDFCRRVPSKVNIIEYNPIRQADFENASEDRLEKFSNFLLGNGVNVQLRRSRGKDIDAACGQLAGKNND